MRKTLKILLLAVMLLVMVGVTMLVASAEGGTFQVATVNGESTTPHGDYATLEEAIAALPQFPGANTIKLLADVEVASTLTINASVTLDGNGKTVQAKGLVIGGEGMVCTIKNVSMVLGAQTIEVLSGTSLTIENSTENTITANSFIVRPDSHLIVTGGTFNFTNTSYTTTSAAFLILGSADIRGGTWTMPLCLIADATGALSTTNGYADIANSTWTFSDIRGFYFLQRKDLPEGRTHGLTLTNVTANAQNSAVTVHSATGKEYSLEIAGGTYKGVINLAKPNGTLYIKDGTFDASALPDITSKDTKKNLLVLGSTGMTVTIENGTFTGLPGSALIAMASGAGCSMTIKNGTFSNTGAGPIVKITKNDCTLNIDDGTFTVETDVIQCTATTGTITLNGGTFNSPAGILPGKTTFSITNGRFNLGTGIQILTATDATISNGEFLGNNEGSPLLTVETALKITGGTFTTTGVAIKAMGVSAVTMENVDITGDIVIEGTAELTIASGEFHFATGMQVQSLTGCTVVIEGGSFSCEGNLICIVRPDGEVEELEAPTVTVSGGTFESNGNAIDAVWGAVTLEGGIFRVNGLSISGETELIINGGEFYGEGAEEEHLFVVAGSAVLTIHDASIEVKGEGYDVFRANEDGVILVDAATITICGGATVANNLTNVTFASDVENNYRPISIVIAAGAILPDDACDGYDGQWWSVNWCVLSEQAAITENTTFTSLEELADFMGSGKIDALLAYEYADIELGNNCYISLVVANGATLTINMEEDIVGIRVTIENGELVIANGKFLVADGATIVSGGALTVENGLFIVTGKNDMLFDCTTINIVKAIVVGEDCTIMAGTALNEYAAQVQYGGETYRAWVKLAATDAEISASQVLGAEIEISAVVEVADGMGGIRFTSTISAAVAEKLLQKYPTATFAFGTVIAPAEYVAAAGAFTMEALGGLDVTGDKYVDIPATVTKVDEDGNGIPEAFSGALISLKSTTRAYAAVSYIKVTTGEGTIVLYGEYDSAVNARSAKQIADAIIADQGSNYYTEFWSPAQKALVDVYAGKVSE